MLHMAANLERLAELFRQYGYNPEADALEAQAGVFREKGIPYEFPDAKEVQRRVLKQKLVEILAAEPYEKGQHLLTLELARKINQHVGQYLEDDTLLETLKVKHIGSYAEFGRGGDGNSQNNRLYQINVNIVSAFNVGINGMRRYTGRTIGAIRKEINFPHSTTDKFFKEAFARPVSIRPLSRRG
jgi:hypothetical protein